MSIFTNIYLNFSKKRFDKPFKPLSKNKRHNFLISAPDNTADFLKTMPYIAGLKNRGTMVMLTPDIHMPICEFIKSSNLIFMFYDSMPEVLTKEHKALKERLKKDHFHYIIELNNPANISLVYLVDAERRISFYDTKKFPYYNIMLRDGLESLCDFFKIHRTDPRKMLKFYSRDIKSTLKKYNKKPPILFVNGADIDTWQGDKIVLGKDITADDADAYRLVIGADAYCGKHDVFFELARILNKNIMP
jgi:hypothetical protein